MRGRGSISSSSGIGISPDARTDERILLDDIAGAVTRGTAPLVTRLAALPLEVNALITARHDEIKREFSARVGEVATCLAELPVPAPPPSVEDTAAACRRVIREECGAPLSAHLTLLTIVDERTKVICDILRNGRETTMRLRSEVNALTRAVIVMREEAAIERRNHWWNRLCRVLRSLWKREDS